MKHIPTYIVSMVAAEETYQHAIEPDDENRMELSVLHYRTALLCQLAVRHATHPLGNTPHNRQLIEWAAEWLS